MTLPCCRAISRRRTVTTIVVVVGLLISFGAIMRVPSADAAAETGIAQEIAVPAYINPRADVPAWNRLIGSTPGKVSISVANVLNGPDYLPNAEWAGVISRTHKAGQKVLGYVDTGYFGTTGQRTRAGSTNTQDWTAQIERDIEAWYSFYGTDIDGIFFDQGHNLCGPTAGSNAYATLYFQINQFEKSAHPGATTVINPGTGVPQCYENVADILLTFESDYNAYIGQSANPVLNYKPLDWTPQDPKKIWHLIYGASQAQVADAITKSQERGAGYVYVTNDVLANPWDTLPVASYWNEETSLVTPTPPARTAIPSTPTVTVAATASTGVTLSWTASTPATRPVLGYDIYDGATKIASQKADVPSYTIKGLKSASAHSFSVVARDAGGSLSTPSAAVAVTTPGPDATPPTAPANVVASATDYTTTHLSWTASTDAEGPITGYEVKLDERDILYLPASVTAVTIGGLPSATASTFTVAAWDGSGHASVGSAPAVATTTALPGGQTIINAKVNETRDAVTYQADFLMPFSFRRIFIVPTIKTQSCWASGTVQKLCVSYLIENGALQRYTGDGTTWTWTKVRDVEPTMSGYTYSWTIKPSDIGSPAAHEVLFNAEGYAPLTYTATPLLAVAPAADLPNETVGGGNPSGFTACECNGSQIDHNSGELSVADVDIDRADRSTDGVQRSLTRTYSSSAAAQPGRLGYGWTDSYDLRVVEDGALGIGGVSVRQENGSLVYFAKQADGTYSAPARFDATLVRQADGSWLFTRKRAAMFTFDTAGRLFTKYDTDGTTLTLGYDVNGELAKVTSSHGGQLTFSYQDGLLMTVADETGRTVTYTYDSQLDLRSETDDRGTTRFEYDNAHRLIKDTGPDRRSTTYAYDLVGRVRTTTDDRRLTSTLDYQIDPVTRSGWSTETVGSWKAVTRYLYENGQLVTQTEDAGTLMASNVKYTVDAMTGSVTKMVDPDGSVSVNPFEDRFMHCLWW